MNAIIKARSRDWRTGVVNLHRGNQDGITAFILPIRNGVPGSIEKINAIYFPPADGHQIPITDLEKLVVNLRGLRDDMQQINVTRRRRVGTPAIIKGMIINAS